MVPCARFVGALFQTWWNAVTSPFPYRCAKGNRAIPSHRQISEEIVEHATHPRWPVMYDDD